jgi:DNA modification methylase
MDLHIQQLRIEDLKPYARNARTHSRKQVRQIADSIRTFGFTNPILIDESAMILAGHGRVAAARLLGMSIVPCVTLSSMTEAQKRAYVIADNKLALNAGWDEDLLCNELRDLGIVDPAFDIGVIGFSPPELDLLLGSGIESDSDPAEDALPALEPKPVSRQGDLWILGPHLLYCGDAKHPEVFGTLLSGQKARMVFTDPPYNVSIAGVVGLGKVKHREFAMASGEMTPEEFVTFLDDVFKNLVSHSSDGSIHFICMDWRHIPELLQAGRCYSELKNLCVWVKDNGGMGTFYRSRHELVFVYKSGQAQHVNNFELGQHGRYRTNVWEYRGINSRGNSRKAELALHPTVKPVAMIADAIRDVSVRDDLVLDCFGGSGSTLIAAHKTNRRARLIELDPLYVDRAIRRWEEYAKDEAILAGTRQSFDALARDIQNNGTRT